MRGRVYNRYLITPTAFRNYLLRNHNNTGVHPRECQEWPYTLLHSETMQIVVTGWYLLTYMHVQRYLPQRSPELDSHLHYAVNLRKSRDCCQYQHSNHLSNKTKCIWPMSNHYKLVRWSCTSVYTCILKSKLIQSLKENMLGLCRCLCAFACICVGRDVRKSTALR